MSDGLDPLGDFTWCIQDYRDQGSAKYYTAIRILITPEVQKRKWRRYFPNTFFQLFNILMP